MKKTDLAVVTLEDATLRVLSEWSAVFISFWRDASTCSSDSFKGIFSAAVSRHSTTSSLERRLKQLEPEVQQGQEEANGEGSV